MSVTTCDLVRAQAITLRQAPIHPERLALMYRHRYLGGADPEALDRLRSTPNEYNSPEIKLVFQCESSDRLRRFEIDREFAFAIRRFDRSHGGTSASPFYCKAYPYRNAPRSNNANE